ncbi:MAG: MBL fold metallo-hydrolase RNA specificity domain-containing protein [Caldilinea sp.]
MEISFLGGADEVGASSILIEIAGRRVLIDAGIRPTPKARWGLAGDQLPDLSLIEHSGGLDAILVTHAHTDHTGALELVSERYPAAPVYATPMTIELTRVLHQDARRIMAARLEEEGELPLYDEVATTRLMAAFTPVALNQPITLAPGLTATWFHAGHIAGAAMIGLASAEGRVLISGDISISPQRTVDGARPPRFGADVLILESTYGGRLHANRRVEEQRLVETVAAITAAGGKVLIPAFALGRAQEILLTLGEYQRRGELAGVPVWADGMVRAICDAYSRYPDALPLALQEQGAAFFGGTIQPVRTAAQRNALIWEAGPAVIVSSSGMLAGGPSVAYARALAGRPENAILLTGYQDEESPGRRLQEMAQRGSGTLRLGTEKVDVQCRLATYSLSAHADTGQLVSFVETLDPAQVFLVHGDEAARTSMAEALRARGRRVRLPRAGQSFGFQFTPVVTPQSAQGIGGRRRPDVRRLWETLTRTAFEHDEESLLFSLETLAQLWWGTQPSPTSRQLAELADALAADTCYFAVDPARTGSYRLRSRGQVELTQRRRGQMAAHGDLTGRRLLARNTEGEAVVGRVVEQLSDHVRLEIGDWEIGDWEIEALGRGSIDIWPENVLAVLDDGADAAAALVQLDAALRTADAPVVMEPNQALAAANEHFPADARLRRTGYRLADHVLTLTFDFPDVAKERYAGALDELAVRTGWTIEVAPEANQAALNALVAECLPAGWEVRKGPSIHRIERRVAVSVAPPHDVARQQRTEIAARFAEISGYSLEIAFVEGRGAKGEEATQPGQIALPTGAEPLEINAAYAAIRQALSGTTLYKTSHKEGAIVLSFISSAVGRRHQAQIDELAQQIGWPLRINPQPNQGAILDTARRLIQERTWRLVKGPSIFLDRAEVAVTLDTAPAADEIATLQADFDASTGFRLAVALISQAAAVPLQRATPPTNQPVVEIAVEQVRVPAAQQGMALNPAKLDNAIARVRRDGAVRPPITVRRVRDGYLLVDGLYRLRAAQVAGLARVAAVVVG